MDLESAVALLGPAGGTLLVCILAAGGLIKTGHIQLGRPAKPDEEHSTTSIARVGCDGGGCPAVRAQGEMLAQVRRLLIEADPGQLTLIQRLAIVDGKVDEVAALIRALVPRGPG
jgi:hypothetical protein